MGSPRLRLIAACLLLTLSHGATPAKPEDERRPAIETSPVIARWMKGMTLRDEVAQLVFVPFHGNYPNPRSREYRKLARLVGQTKIGGLILNNIANGRVVPKAEPHRVATFLNAMQRLATVPLLAGGDFERGASMRVTGATMFPHAMAFGAAGDPKLARYEGEITAREARAIGVHWVFYPVADVNNNPENPIINTRSFGEDPQAVSSLVQAFIEGAHADPNNYVLTAAKHFPGHGDTSVDSHMNLASIPADRRRLDEVELVPFKAAIQAGVDSIMTAHVAVPAVGPADLPATLSHAILTGLLRTDLGFNGLVTTDAMDMGGIAKGFSTGEACVRAIEAGADTLLMPEDPDVAIRAVVAAVQSGRLSRGRIQESVARILTAKEKVGLARRRTVDVSAIRRALATPEATAKAQEIADRAVTLVRNTDNTVPLSPAGRTGFVVMPSSRSASDGQVFADEIRRRAPQAEIVTIDPSMSRAEMEKRLTTLTGSDSYVAAAFATVGANRGSVGLSGELPQAIERLTATGKPVTLIALGSPYLLRNFPNVTAYLATFSTVPVSEAAAARALWGEIPIRGHMPVSIPGLAALGDGIILPALPSGASQ